MTQPRPEKLREGARQAGAGQGVTTSPGMVRPRATLRLKEQLSRDALSASDAYRPLLVQLLANRGIVGEAEIARFFAQSWRAEGQALPNLDVAVARIQRALTDGEHVTVYGDCDTDGMTSCAILTRALSAVGLYVTPYVPHRDADGRGLNPESVRTIGADGTTLLITTDCGTSNVDEAELVRALGMDLIVTDHHPPHGSLPHAVAVVNPQLGDSAAPDAWLAGAGVAFRLAEAVLASSALDAPAGDAALESLLDLAAVGTIGDIVRLTPRNWALARAGLDRLRTSPRPGFRALLAHAGIEPGTVTERDISFAIAPRLNAAARLNQPRLSLDLLLAQTDAEATSLADQLDALNRERQRLLEATFADAQVQAYAQIERADTSGGDLRVVVVIGEKWPLGILGLVASRLVDAFGRTAVVISCDGDVCRGSARGLGDINLGETLAAHADLLVRFGGHERAAGFTLLGARKDEFLHVLESLPSARANEGESRVEGSARNATPVDVDCVLPFDRLVPENLRTVRDLAPYGPGFPEPVFLCRQVRVLNCWATGEGSRTLRLTVAQRLASGREHRRTLYWPRHGALAAEFRPVNGEPQVCDIAYSVDFARRSASGDGEPQLRVVALVPSEEPPT